MKMRRTTLAAGRLTAASTSCRSCASDVVEVKSSTTSSLTVKTLTRNSDDDVVVGVVVVVVVVIVVDIVVVVVVDAEKLIARELTLNFFVFEKVLDILFTQSVR